MLTLQALTYTERHSRTSRTIWNYFTGTQTPSKGSDTMLDWITLLISTVEKHAPMQVVKHRSSCPEMWGLRPATLLKSVWHRCFPVNFMKFPRTPFFTEHLQWLLLKTTRTMESFNHLGTEMFLFQMIYD